MNICGAPVIVCGKYFQEEKLRDGKIIYHDMEFSIADVEEARDALKLLTECGKKNDFSEFIKKFGK